MRATLHLAAALVLLGAAYTCAQIPNPDNLVAPPLHNPAHQHSIHPADDLQWLWQFAQPKPTGDADALRLDPRFPSLLTREFRQPQSMWGPPETHEPLATVIPLFLTKYGEVTATQNRYLTIDGCVPSFCAASGLLWIDLGSPHPLAIFAAVNWTAEGHTTDQASADYNLWLFPNRTLSPNELPFALNEAIAQWNARLAAAHRLVPHIAHAVLVEPNGSPNALDPQLAGANTIAPQPDTATSKSAEDQ